MASIMGEDSFHFTSIHVKEKCREITNSFGFIRTLVLLAEMWPLEGTNVFNFETDVFRGIILHS